jgi:uncharacterized membrane protein YqhA
MANENNRQDSHDPIERFLDKYFEYPFFYLRHITLVPVLLSFCGAILMFSIGAVETFEAIHHFVLDQSQDTIKDSTVLLIKAVDAFLLGLVMMIFSYGIYDLFISKIDPAEKAGARPNWIKFKDMGGLKVTLAQVVLIILIITFFELVLTNVDKFTEDIWMFLIIPIGVLFIGIGIGVFVKITGDH